MEWVLQRSNASLENRHPWIWSAAERWKWIKSEYYSTKDWSRGIWQLNELTVMLYLVSEPRNFLQRRVIARWDVFFPLPSSLFSSLGELLVSTSATTTSSCRAKASIRYICFSDVGSSSSNIVSGSCCRWMEAGELLSEEEAKVGWVMLVNALFPIEIE